MMFSDLRKGFEVHALDTSDIPKYSTGRVVAVSDPRFLPLQPGQLPGMQQRVVDLTVEIGGETRTYTVPESQSVAKSAGITLSVGIDAIANELGAIKRESEKVVGSVDFHKSRIEACDSISSEIDPGYRQSKEQDKRISAIEEKVDGIYDSFGDLKKLILERLK